MKSRADRILKLITASGKSYQELEKITGIRKSSLHRYATGETSKIPVTAIESLAKAFSVSIAYIMWGKNENGQSAQSELSAKKREFIAKVEGMSDEELERLEQILALVENTKQ